MRRFLVLTKSRLRVRVGKAMLVTGRRIITLEAIRWGLDRPVSSLRCPSVPRQ